MNGLNGLTLSLAKEFWFIQSYKNNLIHRGKYIMRLIKPFYCSIMLINKFLNTINILIAISSANIININKFINFVLTQNHNSKIIINIKQFNKLEFLLIS